MPKACSLSSRLAPFKPSFGAASETSWIILFCFIVPMREMRIEAEKRWKLVRTSTGSCSAVRVVRRESRLRFCDAITACHTPHKSLRSLRTSLRPLGLNGLPRSDKKKAHVIGTILVVHVAAVHPHGVVAIVHFLDTNALAFVRTDLQLRCHICGHERLTCAI